MDASKQNEIDLFVTFISELNKFDGQMYFDSLIKESSRIILNIKNDFSWNVSAFETQADYTKLTNSNNDEVADLENQHKIDQSIINTLRKFDIRELRNKRISLEQEIESDRQQLDDKEKELIKLAEKMNY